MDFGTSSVRVSFIEAEDGSVLFSASKHNCIVSPCKGYAQLNPEQLWDNSVCCMSDVVSKLDREKIQISALAFSFFGDNLILCDETYRPLTPLILSFDTRGGGQISTLLDDMGYEKVIRKIGSVPDWSSVPAKYLWLCENKREIIGKTAYCITNQQYILRKLGLAPVNDKTMAFRKSLLNLESAWWDQELLEYLGLTDIQLGEIVESGEVIGSVVEYGNVRFPYPVPVIPGAHDCSLGFAGLGLNENTDTLMGNITGTFDHFGFFRKDIVMNEQLLRQRKNEVLTGCGCFNKSWIVMGAIPAYGTYLEWVVRTFFQDANQETFERLWGQVQFHGPKSIFIYPASTVEKGRMEGMELTTTGVDIFAAAVEALTYESRRVMELCLTCKGERPSEIRIGGGTSRSDIWNQLRADTMGIPFACTQNTEASSMGAAILGAAACGIFHDVESAAKEMIQVTKIFVPDKENNSRYEMGYQRYMEKYY
ncbi:FGGY-family carbohydrate kinase [Blautia schinkii]|nr:FGGY-family carbohydrate kinase [Blautia schinkii]